MRRLRASRAPERQREITSASTSKKSKAVFKESGRHYEQLGEVEWSQDSARVSIVIKDPRIKQASKAFSHLATINFWILVAKAKPFGASAEVLFIFDRGFFRKGHLEILKILWKVAF